MCKRVPKSLVSLCPLQTQRLIIQIILVFASFKKKTRLLQTLCELGLRTMQISPEFNPNQTSSTQVRPVEAASSSRSPSETAKQFAYGRALIPGSWHTEAADPAAAAPTPAASGEARTSVKQDVWSSAGSGAGGDEEPEMGKRDFARAHHVAFFDAMATELPDDYASQEVNHLTLGYFAVGGLSLLRELDRVRSRALRRDAPSIDSLGLNIYVEVRMFRKLYSSIDLWCSGCACVQKMDLDYTW